MDAEFLSLSELLLQVKSSLKKALPKQYWIVAEIMELHENRNGHCYLELIEKEKESDALTARIRATIWSSRYGMLSPFFELSSGSKLKSGIKLLCKAAVEYHPVYGFSLNITDIDPSYTLGDLARKKQEVIRRLREEGIFDMNRELHFPPVPQRIAVISSDTAAGYGDFMESMMANKHGFHFHTMLFPAVMQGDDAPPSVVAALDAIHASEEDFDCVVLIRGGGSRADLESFNHYDMACHIAQFPLPVLTGIGHERDESVADMVAAFGLKTPTAVAEFLVDHLLSFSFRLAALRDRLTDSVKRRVQGELLRLKRIEGSLVHSSRAKIRQERDYLGQIRSSLARESAHMFSLKKEQLALLQKRKELNDPVNILKKGYSITLVDGNAIGSVEELKAGTTMETRLRGGHIWSKVEKTKKK